MLSGKGRVSRVRVIGLIASLIALCAIGLTFVADNQNTGFGHTITAAQQLTILLLAVILVVAQGAAYVVNRRKNRF